MRLFQAVRVRQGPGLIAGRKVRTAGCSTVPIRRRGGYIFLSKAQGGPLRVR